MARLVKSAQVGDRSVLLSKTASGRPALPPASTETPSLSQALLHMETPAIAIEATARAAEAKAAAELLRIQEEQLKQLEADARDKGYAEGRAVAVEAVEKEWKSRLARVDQLLEALEQSRRSCEAEVEDVAVAIAFEAVAKIIGRKAATIEIVREAIGTVRNAEHGQEPVTIRVGLEDYEALVAEPFIIALEEDQGRVRLVEDPRVAFGGCIVESSRGSLDARIETQLDRLHRILLETRRAEEA